MFSKPIAADEAFKIIKADYEQRHQQHYTQSIDSKGIPVVAFNQSAPLDTVVCIQSKKGFDVWRISTNEVHLPRKTKTFVTTSENIKTHTSEASSLRLEIANMLKTNSDHTIRKKKTILLDKIESSIARYEKNTMLATCSPTSTEFVDTMGEKTDVSLRHPIVDPMGDNNHTHDMDHHQDDTCTQNGDSPSEHSDVDTDNDTFNSEQDIPLKRKRNVCFIDASHAVRRKLHMDDDSGEESDHTDGIISR
jgi:hypothetical protein